MLGQLTTDVRYAARIALRRKWVSAAILVSVAFGIGGATAIFAVIDRVLLRPLPVPSPEQVVWVRMIDSKFAGRVSRGVNPGDERDVRTRATSFSRMAAYNWGEATVQPGEDAPAERVRMALVADGMMEVFGAGPVLGQTFSAEDYAAPSNNVLVTHRYWRRALASDSSVIGRTILVNNVGRTVIGVLPPAADLLPEADFEIWRPWRDNPQQLAQSRTASFLIALARVKPSVPLARAQVEIDAIARALAAEHPQTNATRGFLLQALTDGVVGQARPMFLLLGGATLMVLLIACASVGNLLVAQSEERARELAVRAALGGSGGRLIRQLLTESLLLCAIGGALGILLAPMLLRGFALLYPGGVPRAAELGVDLRVLLASTGAIMLVGVLAALPLVRQSVRLELARDLRDGGRTAGSVRQRRFASALVVGQLALSVALLFGGALLLSTYRRLAAVNIGFDASHLLTFNLAPSRARYPTNEQLDGYYGRLIDGISRLPGVRAVATSNLIPFESGNWSEYFAREGKDDQLPNKPLATHQVVSDDYLAVVGLPLIRGRRLTAADADSAPPVIVVNAALAAAYYPGEDPIGRRVTMRGRSWEIVGVVGDKRHASVKAAPFPEMFLSRRQLPRDAGSWVIVRSTSDSPALVAGVRAVAREIDQTVPVAHVATMVERLSEGVAPERFRATVVACFALLALVLATVGLYGVVSHTVSRRTREIGIRMALGENAASLVRRVIQGAGIMSLAGALLGAFGSLAVARALEAFLVDTRVWDPALLLGLVALLGAVTVGAAYIPARRASRVDPIIALRSD